METKITARKDKERAFEAALTAVSGHGGAEPKAKKGRMEDWYGEGGKAAKRAADDAICLFITGTRLGETICQHPLFLNMLRAVNAAGTSYVPPKRGYVGGAGLLACKQQIEKAGAVFQEAVDCKAETNSGAFIMSVLQPVIEKVGPEHVVAICTDGGSNYVSATKLLQKKYPHIEFVPCATHVLDLLLEDFDSMAWAQEVVPVATDMISFIRSHTWTRAFLRCPELHGEEKSLQPLRPAGTRFGTQYIAVSRLREIRPQLTAMVTHKDWEEKGRKQLTGKDFEASVLDVEWWAKVDTFVNVMALPYKVMRKTDGPAKGMMGAMYDMMLQLTEDLSALLESADCPLSDADKEGLLEHLRRRCDESLACPLHVVGRILNPVNQEEGIYLKDIECTRVMKVWLSRSRAFVDNGEVRKAGVVEGNIPTPPLPEGYRLEEDGEREVDEDDMMVDEYKDQDEKKDSEEDGDE
ncbi:unnamed protein product [Closterium sp. NIES-64]|nr:unnamed protein product [Closterium sp. NIES-64]